MAGRGGATTADPLVHDAPTAHGMAAQRARARRAWWLRQLHQWHWISSAICLAGMLLFAITGITLNHSGRIEAKPQLRQLHGAVPPALLATLADVEAGALPRELRRWFSAERGLHLPAREAEWSPDEVYLALPRPGGDAWIALNLDDGSFEYELTDRGWIAYLNDLHKGRHTGPAWSLFLDLFAAACVLFSLTGLLILQLHARSRPAVWPLVAAGAALPVLLALLFIH